MQLNRRVVMVNVLPQLERLARVGNALVWRWFNAQTFKDSMVEMEVVAWWEEHDHIQERILTLPILASQFNLRSWCLERFKRAKPQTSQQSTSHP